MKLIKADAPQNMLFDRLKWLAVAVFLIAGLVANYFYASQPWPLRLLGWLVVLALVFVTAFQTSQGKIALNFMRESRMELRKVFWPTRQETMQTTLVVAVMVIVLALMLWGIDGVLVWLIGWLTGQRG